MDKNNSNHAISNLAFLCFDHHDEYDSISSQRKNLTIGEVKKFRDELYTTINKAFTQQVHFGEITTPPSDPYAGSWIRIGSINNSAEITLTPLPDTIDGLVQYYVSGQALWGAHREYGPNMGFLGYVGIKAEGEERIYPSKSWAYGEDNCRIILDFADINEAIVRDKSPTGTYGANVSFDGSYRRER
ncbi:hypothetical protein [Novosphingobium sp. Rr 2-17]|uniref:hypothetical protein n=1 Tax=Novosphingobium sp. Rr 2-17 TaxID=555793 RepID=UPI0012F69B3A|nr:hypothetical protein [Novosphingobium sp. Rr 2-17]